MKKGSFIVILLAMICLPTSIFAQHDFSVDRLEFGVYGGLGFYVGPRHGDMQLTQVYDIAHLKLNNLQGTNWPGIETFGFSVGYRIDTRWQVQLQTFRQRTCFTNQDQHLYYNAMWHLDAMAEFNILQYGAEMRPELGVYNIVPYVGLGYGITMYNAEATLRTTRKNGIVGSMYPAVGFKKDSVGKYIKGEHIPTNLAMYIPIACGVKWRFHQNVQLKAQFQYQMYIQQKDKSIEDPSWTPIFNSSIEGSSAGTQPDKIYGRVVGDHHNFMFSLGLIVNFGSWHENLRKSNVRF